MVQKKRKVVVVATGGTILCGVRKKDNRKDPLINAERLISILTNPTLENIGKELEGIKGEVEKEIYLQEARVVKKTIESLISEKQKGKLERTEIVVEHVRPYIDSSDISDEDWMTMVEVIGKVIQREKPDGVVVLHGTDTEDYTAHALSFMLENLPCPVVLTGAMLAPFEVAKDGSVTDVWKNLADSIWVAADGKFAEVGICLAGKVHRGVRVHHDAESKPRAFRSVYGDEDPRYIATIDGDTLSYDDIRRRGSKKRELKVNTAYISNVKQEIPTPFSTAQDLKDRLEKKPFGLVLLGYFGTPPSEETRQVLLDNFVETLVLRLKKAEEKGAIVHQISTAPNVPVVLSSQIQGGVCKPSYATDDAIGNSPAIYASDMLPKVCLVKLAFVTGALDQVWGRLEEPTSKEEEMARKVRYVRLVKELMLTDFLGEISGKSVRVEKKPLSTTVEWMNAKVSLFSEKDMKKEYALTACSHLLSFCNTKA